MKSQTKMPHKPTSEESKILENCLSMQAWHFDTTIKTKCTEIATSAIFWNKSIPDFHWEYAQIFGLKALKADNRESCIANFFIRYQGRVYQTYGLENIVEILLLLKKEASYVDYQREQTALRWKARRKLAIAKEPNNVKRLKVVKTQVA